MITNNRRLNETAPARFDRFVHTVPEAGCWLWGGSVVRSTGYGRFGVNSRHVDYAHRAAWMLFRGAIPHGMQVCHKCDTPTCVNPDHLFIGTGTDNMRDAANKGRIRVPVENFASSDAHQVAKLTNDDVREIRSSSDGLTSLSRKFGVSIMSIWKAKTRRSFRDVP